MRTLQILASFAPLAIAASDCLAFGGGSSLPWNRRIEAVAVTPTSAPGKFDVHVVWTIEVTPNSTLLNLNTNMALFVGTSSVPLISPHVVQLNPGGGFCGTGGCGGSCGTGYIDGITAAAYLCIDADSDGDCGCSMPWITSTIPNVELEEGETITALLLPGTGGVAEIAPADDKKVFQFGGERRWDRAITGAKLVPGPAAGLFALEIEGEAGWKGMDHAFNLGMEVEILDPAGTPLGVVDIAGIAKPDQSDPLACNGVGCGGFCGNWNGFDIDCYQGTPFAGCMCGGGFLAYWFDTDNTPEPGDTLVLVLHPSPNALPALPGSQGAQVLTVTLALPCPADLNGDGQVNGADLGMLLADWGGDGEGDLNDDGTVNGADLGAMLAAWGEC